MSTPDRSTSATDAPVDRNAPSAIDPMANAPARVTPAPPRAAAGAGPVLDYDTAAGVIGGVPNLRGDDNLFQLKIIAGFVVVGVAVMPFVITDPAASIWLKLGLGLLLGFILGGIVSGGILMIMGWLRFGKKLADLPRPGRCKKCDYNLAATPSGKCPECGTLNPQ